MSETLLTVDLGNSRCKLRLWTPAGDLLRGLDLSLLRDGAPDWLAPGMAWLRESRGAAAAAYCAVAAPQWERELCEGLGPLVDEGRLRSPDSGLVLELESAHTVGADRLFAARGALEHARASALVVDAGTALTVDALAWRGERGHFLGGAIAAGPTLVARALSEHAARLPRIEPRPGVAALGRDTHAALQAGVAVGFRGAARELVESLTRESGMREAAVFLTGGARAFLLEPRPFVDRRIEVVPDLVHLGLLAALRADLGRA